jgi:hypothetical protein
LLRFHAQYEDAARKLSVASAVSGNVLTGALKTLVEFGTAAVTAIESSLGIARPPEAAVSAEPNPPPVAATTTPAASTPANTKPELAAH